MEMMGEFSCFLGECNHYHLLIKLYHWSNNCSDALKINYWLNTLGHTIIII